ncbi:MAG: transporter [Frankiales bacterium]|nr:transporter [Frankiales bacterium]
MTPRPGRRRTGPPRAPDPAGRTLPALAFAALVFALSQTALIPAIPGIARTVGTSTAAATWTLSAYFLSAAVCTPILGRLGDMFGKRRLLLVSLGFLALGSAVSALGDTLGVVVAGRVLQGAGSGVFPLSFSILRDVLPRRRVSSAIGSVAAIAGIGAGLGLVLGGVLVDHLSFRAIFWATGGVTLLAAVAVAALVPCSTLRSPGHVDVLGGAALAVVILTPLVGVSRAGQVGWSSPATLALLGASPLLAAGWVLLQRTTRQPLIDVRLLAQPRVLLTNVSTFLVGAGMFGVLILIPELAQAPRSTGYGFGVDATSAGLLLVPGALLGLGCGPLTGRLVESFGAKVPLVTGACTAACGLVLLGLRHGSVLEVMAWASVLFVGTNLAFAAMPNLVMEAVDARRTGEATGMNTLVRSAGSSVGSQVMAATLAGSVALDGFPSERGFTTAFLLAAGIAFAGAGAAVLIPHRLPEADGAAPV